MKLGLHFCFHFNLFNCSRCLIQVSGVPSLTFGYASNGAECVCVGNSLTLFSDQSCQTVLLHSKFDSQIETFACSVDGNFLLVALENGFFHCLHIPTEGEPVYAKYVFCCRILLPF